MRILTISLLLATVTLSGLLTGCLSSLPEDIHLQGNILLWHSWDEQDALVLERVLDQIPEISPDTYVISMHVPTEELKERYITATQQGVGPDLLIGPNAWVRELVEAGVAHPIEPDEYGLNAYMPATLTALRYQEHYYGFPLAVFPAALYYNQTLTQPPLPQTLGELLDAADAGKNVAFVPRFQPAYWGVQPFGAGFFDATGGFTLDESGFSEWLTWLGEVSHLPGVILNPDVMALQQMFIEGRVAYYVAGPEALGPLLEVMGEDAIGVTVLPSGPEGPSGPLLPVEAIILGTSSSADQTASALAVARFLTNPKQSTTFMREIGLVPANQDVDVDRRIYPNLAGFARQARTADVLPNDLYREAFFLLGDRAYASVLAGTLSPEEAVCEFGLDVVALQGYTDEEADLPADCAPSEVVE